MLNVRRPWDGTDSRTSGTTAHSGLATILKSWPCGQLVIGRWLHASVTHKAPFSSISWQPHMLCLPCKMWRNKKKSSSELSCLTTKHRSYSYMGVSKNTGTPRWMVYNGNPYYLLDDLGGKPHYFRKHPYDMVVYFQAWCFLKTHVNARPNKQFHIPVCQQIIPLTKRIKDP